MPAFGKNLAPQEVTALVAFMQTLRPANVPRGARPGCSRGQCDNDWSSGVMAEERSDRSTAVLE